MQLEVGTVLDGRVTGITSFGAFVALPDGKSGLVHISEVANTFVSDIHAFLSENQEVKVKVIGITPEGKINLSIKKALESAAPVARPYTHSDTSARRTERPAPAANTVQAAQPYVPQKSDDRNFEDKLKQFMQESDRKMSGNKLFEQQKKGQRRRK